MYETTHSYRLARLLEMTHMGPTEFKRSITKIIPRELAYRSFNDKTGEFEVHNARELLTQQGAEVASSLIPIEVMGTIIEGSEPAKCIRNVFPIYQMNSEYLKIPYGETGTYAPIVAEGAEVPIQDQTYSAVSLTASKYAVRPLISREMVNDQKFDVIAAELRKAGWRIENALNRYAIAQLVAANNTTYTTTTSVGTPVPLKQLGAAVAALAGRGFMPTDIIMTPALYGNVLGAFTGVFTGQGASVTSSGQLGQLMGCRTWMCGIAAATVANWRFTTSSDVAGYVINRDAAAALGMRQDINVEQYRDPVRDLFGMLVSARFDIQVPLATATQSITAAS